ncbi:MAG: SPASM domain-containing protein [Oscillospiraceae bacterium]|nr:SPASM domain-containing protein [Oscillospiraceae bacterium]
MKQFIERIENGKEYVITTNGTLLDEDFAEWCFEESGKNVRINMSHDGKTCADRGADPALLDEKVKMLLKYQEDTLIQLVYTEQTLPDLYDNVLHLSGLGVKNVSAALDGFASPADPDSFGDLMREQWDKLGHLHGVSMHELTAKRKFIKENIRPKCEICKKKVYINWDGNFYPCIQFQNLSGFRCGDVNTGILTKEAEKAHPDYSVMSARCDGCEIRDYCRNSCACRKMGTTGTLTDISEAACMEEQVHILTALEQISESRQRKMKTEEKPAKRSGKSVS